MSEEKNFINGIRQKKKKNLFPVIKRTDIMAGILSNSLDKETRMILSNLYAEITYMEQRDLKYITEITVSSQLESDIYDKLKMISNQHLVKENYG